MLETIRLPARRSREPETSFAPDFTERPVWRPVGHGWRHLHGSVQGLGCEF